MAGFDGAEWISKSIPQPLLNSPTREEETGRGRASGPFLLLLFIPALRSALLLVFIALRKPDHFAACGGGTTLNTNDVGVSEAPNGPGTLLETGGRLLS